jgi:hypothetical protein
MDGMEFETGEAGPIRRARTRKAALEALERLLQAHAVLSAQRSPESSYSLLRPARPEEIELIEAVFLYCGVPLPDTLRAIYGRTLGVGNPISALPILSVPFLRAALPDEGFGSQWVGLEMFETALGVFRDETALERPHFLSLGHAAPVGLTVSRNGLCSLEDYEGHQSLPPAEDFNLVFEVAFCTFVDQVLLTWANDLAGAVLKPQDLDLRRGARLNTLPPGVQDAMAQLLTPRSVRPQCQGEVQALDHTDLMRLTRRGGEGTVEALHGPAIAVVGLPYGDYPEVAGQIAPGTLLRMQPVGDNPHDENAIEVWYDEGSAPARVGFVERSNAPRIRHLPQGATAWRLRVVERSDQVIYATLELVRQDAVRGLTDASLVSDLASANDYDLFSSSQAPKAWRPEQP